MGKRTGFTAPTPSTTPLTQTGPSDLFCKEEEAWEPSKDLSRDCPRTPRKSKQVRKPKVTRVFNPEDRFLAPHIERYYLFPFHYSREHPYFRISWRNWKPNGIYKKMAAFLSNLREGVPNKTPNQCKSYDERMKYLHFEEEAHQPRDLLDASLDYFEQAGLDSRVEQCIGQYVDCMQRKSSYVSFLERECRMRGDPVPQESEAPAVKQEVKLEARPAREEFEVYFADSAMSHNEFFDG